MSIFANKQKQGQVKEQDSKLLIEEMTRVMHKSLREYQNGIVRKTVIRQRIKIIQEQLKSVPKETDKFFLLYGAKSFLLNLINRPVQQLDDVRVPRFILSYGKNFYQIDKAGV